MNARNTLHSLGNFIAALIFAAFAIAWFRVFLTPNPHTLTTALMSTLVVGLMLLAFKGVQNGYR